MPTPEEIKKIAREYGESVVNRSDYDILNPINPGEAYRQRVANEAKQAESMLEWLSKDYCIVEKSKIKEWKSITDDALKSGRGITEPAFRYMWKRLFEEEK